MLCDKCAWIGARINQRIAWLEAHAGNPYVPPNDPEGAETDHSHHSSFKDIVIAAELGCDLCTLITREPGVLGSTRKDTGWLIQISFLGATVRIVEDYELESDHNPEDNYIIGGDGETEVGGGLDVGQEVEVSYREQQDDAKEDDSVEADSVPAVENKEEFPCDIWLNLGVEDGCSETILDAFPHRAINSSPRSPACFNLIKDWMNYCLSHHQEICGRPLATFPTRLIDVGLGISSSSSVYLRVMDPAETGRWVALSHCWGTHTNHLKTTTANFEDRQSGIALADLPATFQDAVEVTRELGLQYLWIDSLCILQDKREDWVHESSLMHAYYRDSTLTIAADCAAGDEEGFLHRDRNSRSEVIRFPIQSKALLTESESSAMFENKLHVLLTTKDANVLTASIPTRGGRPINEKEPLHTRGWTLQEHILSPRTIHYTSRELRWSCQRYVSVESHRDITFRDLKHHFLCPTQVTYTASAPWSMHGSGTWSFEHDDSSYRHWYRLLEDYVHRNLTLASDKLPAISGLAREVHLQTGSQYMAGIWRRDIHRGLLWALHECGRLPETWRAPSWSWASLDVATEIPAPGKSLGLYGSVVGIDIHSSESWEAEILKCEAESLSGDIFGGIASAKLTLNSYWTPWTRGIVEGIYGTSLNRPVLERHDETRVVRYGSIILNFDQLCGLDEEQFSDLSIVYIAFSFGLLLKPAETLGCFRRIGRVELPGFYTEWEMRDIAIV